MEDCELDMIPEMWKKGSLSKEEAVMKILERVYMNPGRFNLLDMDEDERSDFLLSAVPKFKGILDRYDKRLGPLGAYLFYSLPGIRLSWSRKKEEETASKRATRRNLKNIYEIEVEKNSRLGRAGEDGSLKVRDAGGDGFEEPLVFRRVFGRRKNLLEPKEVFYKKRAAFVLALKSAWYIDDSSLGKISGYCGFSKERVFETMRKIKDSLLERSEKRAKVEACRDRAWGFVCKYREMLARTDPSSSKFILLKKKLDYQLNSWKNKNKLLQSCQMTLAPRNNELAKILKVKPYRISVFLNYAKKLEKSGERLLCADDGEDLRKP